MLNSVSNSLTAFLWIPIITDKHFLVWCPEERRPVYSVVEAQATVVKNVYIPRADLIQWLELKWRDPTLLQNQQRDTANAGNKEEKEILTRGKGSRTDKKLKKERGGQEMGKNKWDKREKNMKEFQTKTG